MRRLYEESFTLSQHSSDNLRDVAVHLFRGQGAIEAVVKQLLLVSASVGETLRALSLHDEYVSIVVVPQNLLLLVR